MPAAVTTVVKWNPATLDRAILAAFKPSLVNATRDAQVHSPSKAKAGAKLIGVNTASLETARGTIAPTGLGTVFEVGAAPHVIAPGGMVASRRSFRGGEATFRDRRKRGGKPFLYLKGPGVFVSGPVQHPGAAAKPYIKPAGVRWAQGGFQAFARRSLSSRGFR